MSYEKITDDDPYEFVWGDDIQFEPDDDSIESEAEFYMRRTLAALLNDHPYMAQVYLQSYLVQHDALEGRK